MYRRLAGAIALSSMILSPAVGQYSFTELPQFGAYDLAGLSPDGGTILGSSAPSPFGGPVYIQNGQPHLLPLGGFGNGTALSMALDGTIVGGLATGESETITQAAVWRNGVLSLLEHEPSGEVADARAISANGHVVVGRSSAPTHAGQAARWVDGHVEPLGDLPGGFTTGEALAVNAYGSVIVGTADGRSRAFRWMNGTMEALPLINGGDIEYSEAVDISADGRRIVGQQTHFNFLTDGLLWEDGVPRNLGYLPGANRTFAEAISDDGSLIFGESGVGFTTRAFIWDDSYGIRDLAQVLSDAGVDLLGWRRLSFIRDVSADGRTIFGYGENGQGIPTYFIATIPEPSTLSLAAVSFVMLSRRANGRPDSIRRNACVRCG